MTTPAAPIVHKGGSWLLEDSHQDGVFTPEQLSEEHRLIDQTARAFVSNEVLAKTDEPAAKNWHVARHLLRAARELISFALVHEQRTHHVAGDWSGQQGAEILRLDFQAQVD